MKKSLKINKKKLLIGLSVVPIVATPIQVISCSSTNVNNVANSRNEINKQYDIFYNSLVNEQIQNDLYFQNFNFDPSTNKTKPLSIDEISKYISIPELSNSFEYQFIVEKIDNYVQIEMQMQFKNDGSSSKWNLLPSEAHKKYKKIENVKNLDSAKIQEIQNAYNQWQSQASSLIKITNTQTSMTLSKNKYGDCLPSFFGLENISITFNQSGTTPFATSNSENKEVSYEFNDINGTIEATLSITNSKTGLTYYLQDSEDKRVAIIEGFAKLEEKNNEVISMYSTFSKTFDLKSILGGQEIAFLASEINSINKISSLFLAIDGKKSNEDARKIANLITELSQTQNNKYRLTASTSASDTIGNLIINWTIIDSFTGYEIKPESISRLTTVNEMIKLVTTTEVDGVEKKDYSQIQNGYDAYQGFKELKIKANNANLNKKASSLVNDQSSSQINNDWLKMNTNIDEIFTLNDDQMGYLSFSLTNGATTSNFRFKIDSQNIKGNVFADDVNGILSIRFMMQIQVKVNGTPTWIDFLPPSRVINNGGEISYESASREEFIKIGGFLTNDAEVAKLVYDVFANTAPQKNIDIVIDNEYQFDSILNEVKYDESKIPSLLENEIKENILSNFTSVPNNTNYKKVQDLLNKYKLDFSFMKNTPISYSEDTMVKTISTNVVDFKLSSKTNSTYLPYYDETNGNQKAFPKIKITITFNITNNPAK